MNEHELKILEEFKNSIREQIQKLFLELYNYEQMGTRKVKIEWIRENLSDIRNFMESQYLEYVRTKKEYEVAPVWRKVHKSSREEE